MATKAKDAKVEADTRDTAKDLIHGYQPSGTVPKDQRGNPNKQQQVSNRVNTTLNVGSRTNTRPVAGGGPSTASNTGPSVHTNATGVSSSSRPTDQRAAANNVDVSRSATLGGRPMAPVVPMRQGGGSAGQTGGDGEQRHLADANRQLRDELARVKGQMGNFQRQQAEIIHGEQNARRQLEQQLQHNLQLMNRMSEKVREGEAQNKHQLARDLDDMRKSGSDLNAKILHSNQDMSHLKGIVDMHSADLMQLNQEVKNRPVADPQKANSAQQMDAKMRDLHGQMMGIRQLIDQEMNDRRRVDQVHAVNTAKLQEYIEKQDAGKSQVLQNLAKQGDTSNAKMNEETRRLNEKIAIITEEVTRSMTDKEQRIRDENHQNYLTLEKAIKAELEARLQYEKDIRKFLEERWGNYSEELDELKDVQTNDRQKYKDRFQKLSEALVILEKHLEQGNKKMDKLMAAEIQARKIHEKNLLGKVSDIEERLGSFLKTLDKSIEDAKNSRDSKPPQLDMDALRRDMDSIAADKHKLSMEGLLKLEEKMRRIDIGLNKDKRELVSKLDTVADAEMLSKLRSQMEKLERIQDDLEKAHERVLDKVERQTPQDLNELSQKLENFKKQMHNRIDKEEEERYLAVKELQDAIEKIRTGNFLGGTAVTNQSLQKEIDKSKLEIKALASNVAATKNALERRLDEEIRQVTKYPPLRISAPKADVGKKAARAPIRGNTREQNEDTRYATGVVAAERAEADAAALAAAKAAAKKAARVNAFNKV